MDTLMHVGTSSVAYRTPVSRLSCSGSSSPIHIVCQLCPSRNFRLSACKFLAGEAALKVPATSGRKLLKAKRGIQVSADSVGEDSSSGQTSSTVQEAPPPLVVEEDYPDDYVLVSDDPDEIAKEIKRIEEENKLLREKIAIATTESVELAEDRRDRIDVTRPRFNAEAPVDETRLSGASFASVATPVAKAPQAAPVAQEEAVPASSRSKELEKSELARSAISTKKQKTDNPISIVFVASEVAPYSKTGGLADVVGSLPVALAERGHRVMVVSPRYMNGVTDKLYDSAFDCQCRIKVNCFDGEHEVAFFHEFRDGVDFVFVDHPSYHRPGTPYGDTRGAFGDNQFRFTVLCHAACEAPLQLALGGFTYGENVLFVANDWHAGLVPVLLAAKYRKYNVYTKARCLLCIHNLAHQGVEPGVTFQNLGLPGEWYGALEWVFPQWQRAHALDKGEAVNILKGALVTSDRILTVSQGYAWEITTPEGGCGLDGLLRSRSTVLNGITNGVDVVDWNPVTDKHIPSQFSVEDLSGKAECKAALQKELGLPVRPEVPLIGFIGRLDHQKGPDIIQAALPQLLTDDVQMVMLGSGDPNVESWMTWAENEYTDKFRGWVGFSVPVAHRITAGCDILLMPSRFEPCGLNQLYAMRYGTVPVAHCTGGLRDTIEDFNPFAQGGLGAGTGWTFSPLSVEGMMGAMWTAIATYRQNKDQWKAMMLRGMTSDMSWERAALQYEQVFQWALMDPPYA